MTFRPPQVTVMGFPVRTTGPGYLPRSIQALQALAAWRNEGAETPDAWLRQDVCTAFQFLVGLRLGNTPAVEMLPITAEMWIEVVGEGLTEELDRERIRAGFKRLRRELKWWPQPSELLKILPRRNVVAGFKPAPTEPQTEEEHAAASAKFQEILDSFKE